MKTINNKKNLLCVCTSICVIYSFSRRSRRRKESREKIKRNHRTHIADENEKNNSYHSLKE